MRHAVMGVSRDGYAHSTRRGQRYTMGRHFASAVVYIAEGKRPGARRDRSSTGNQYGKWIEKLRPVVVPD